MLEKLRLLLAKPLASGWESAVLGMLVGLFTGIVIILFRTTAEWLQVSFLDGNPENYESLPTWALFALPTAGGILLGILFQLVNEKHRTVGVVHTLERLDYHQGKFLPTNMLMQFVGATISIVSGHSVGREGPAIHLGAASASMIGQGLDLPNNSVRTLVACGVAAAIAASFNTPLAGVIFTIEVIMLEYTLSSMLPIILAAVSATVLSRLVFGDHSIFAVPSMSLGGSYDLIIVFIVGLGIGAIAAAFNFLILYFSKRTNAWPIFVRMSIAGIFTGLCALAAPEIMSIGYDTVTDAVLGHIAFTALLAIVFFKLLATTVCVGFGLPGGLIGPTVFLGATCGAIFASIVTLLWPSYVTEQGLFAMIGMAAMMSAVLQAPLAALMAIFELTLNPHIILPGMLAIVVANLTSNLAFKQQSLIRSLLQARGLDYNNSPAALALRRIGITTVAKSDFIITDEQIPRQELEKKLESHPRWLLIQTNDKKFKILPAIDVTRHLAESEGDVINLLEIPGNRLDSNAISSNASLQDAFEQLELDQVEALIVQRNPSQFSSKIYGIVTREDIETQQKTAKFG